MQCQSIGEWVKGPFANATIEGFIVNETYGSYEIIIKKIDDACGPLPPRLQFGSVHNLPKRVIDDFFIRFNQSQQDEMIRLASSLGQVSWADELLDQFYNPFIKMRPPVLKGEEVYSTLLKRFIKLVKEVKEKLYRFYQNAVEKGMSARFRSPDDINNSEALDVAISSILLVSKDKEGINYIRSLIRKGEEKI